MDKSEIIERLKNIAEHAVHTVGGSPFVMSFDDGIAVHEAIELLEKLEPLTDREEAVDESKYEYHYDHTDCIWYRPEARNRCPVTCAQYRDGWNDAMNYIFREGKGYRPFRRGKEYGE